MANNRDLEIKMAEVAQPANTIQVFSIGYLFNAKYREILQSKNPGYDPVITANRELTDFIKTKITTPKPILISGAEVQSPHQERELSKNVHTGLISDGLEIVAGHLATELNTDIVLDKFLLSHIFRETPSERSKLLLLYTQMQRMAQNTKHAIEFWFFQQSENELNKLNIFFTRYPHLKPNNITLKLAVYNGTVAPNLLHTLTPSSSSFLSTDFNYRVNTPNFYKLFEDTFIPDDVISKRATATFMSNYLASTTPDEDDLDKTKERSNAVVRNFIALKLANKQENPDNHFTEQTTVSPKNPNSQIEIAKKQLRLYRDVRLSDERGEYFSFFGKFIMMSCTVKISTVKKLLQMLDGEKNVIFSELEIEAARNGRLGKNIAALEHNPQIENIFAAFHRQERAKILKTTRRARL